MTELRRFKYVTTVVIEFWKIESDDTKFNTFYSNSKAERVINENNTDEVFKSIWATIKSKIEKYLGKDSGWIIN